MSTSPDVIIGNKKPVGIPGAITIGSGARSRYKLEIFPRVWFKSSKPSLWQRIGLFLVFGKRVIELPPIETCPHKFERRTKEHHRTGVITPYNYCPRCEVEEDIPDADTH